MKRSPNARLWQTSGVIREGQGLADQAMPHMLKALVGLPEDLAYTVFKEAVFQTYQLPTRTPAFQRENQWRKP